MVAVGENLGLQRQEGAARVDEVDARQPVLDRHLLRAQVLLHRQREIRAALHRGIVRDDHAVASLDDADACDDPRRGSLPVVEFPRGQGAQLEERRPRVEQPVDPLACRQLSPGAMSLEGVLAAALGDRRRALPELGHERLHALPATLEDVVARDV